MEPAPEEARIAKKAGATGIAAYASEDSWRPAHRRGAKSLRVRTCDSLARLARLASWTHHVILDIVCCMDAPGVPTDHEDLSDAQVAANDQASSDLYGTIAETLANLAAGVVRGLP